jgi:hypothetical protein
MSSEKRVRLFSLLVDKVLMREVAESCFSIDRVGRGDEEWVRFFERGICEWDGGVDRTRSVVF